MEARAPNIRPGGRCPASGQNRTAWQVGFLRAHRLDHRALRVIDQHQDMRQFQATRPGGSHAGRQAFDDRPFGGADEALRAFCISYCSRSRATIRPRRVRRPKCAPPDQAVSAEAVFSARYAHVLLDVPGCARPSPGFSRNTSGRIRLRWRAPRRPLAPPLPIFRLGSELVAGDDSPFGGIRLRARQENLRNLYADGPVGIIHEVCLSIAAKSIAQPDYTQKIDGIEERAVPKR